MKTIQQIETSRGTFSIETALSQGWKLVSPHLLYYILGGIITMIISFATGIIPIAGTIANSLVISPCLMAGAIYVTWRISQGIAWTDFGDMFKGFNNLVPLMLATLIQGIISLAIVALLLFNFVPQFIELYKLSSGTGSFNNKEEIQEIVMGMLSMKNFALFGIAMLLIGFLSLIWSFKTHFIVIYNMQGWQAMELSRKVVMQNFVSLLGLFILLGIILLISALPCGIGLLFTMPWMIGSIYSAFAQITESHDVHDIRKEGFDFMKEESEEE
ncbi:MAG: hypothetical protein IPI46_04945 [Bacteroidetes bacterium]|nr:hypothetical protein [Bacteroidota bacterium]